MSNKKLEYKKLPDHATTVQYRVMYLDPVPVYERIKHLINHRDRYQQNLSMEKMWPVIKGQCSCGCGKLLTGKRTRWANDECYDFANMVYAIFYGNLEVVRDLLRLYYGEYKCVKCERHESGQLYVDHITAVMNNGGGYWLSNYQLLCAAHHDRKTKADMGRPQFKDLN